MKLNGSGTDEMKRVIVLERVSDAGRADRAFFRFCLRRQPALWGRLLPHIGTGLLFGLGFIREETYLRRFWRFMRDLKKPEELLSAFAVRYRRRHPLFLPEKGMTVVSAMPQPFAEALLEGYTVRANPFRMETGTYASFCGVRELLLREAAASHAEEHAFEKCVPAESGSDLSGKSAWNIGTEGPGIQTAAQTADSGKNGAQVPASFADTGAETEQSGERTAAHRGLAEPSEDEADAGSTPASLKTGTGVRSASGRACSPEAGCRAEAQAPQRLPDGERLSEAGDAVSDGGGAEKRSGGCIVYTGPFHAEACGAAQMRYCVRTPSGRVKLFADRRKARRAGCRYAAVPFLLLACWAVFLSGVSLYDASITHNYTLSLFFSYFTNPLIPLLNTLPVLFLAYLLYAAVGSCAWSAALTSLVTLALSWSNYFKMMFRNDPVIAEDIRNLALALEFGGKYHIALGKKMIAVLLLTVLVIGLSAVYVRRRVLTGRWRAGLLAVLLLTGFFGLKGIYFNDRIYNGIQNYSACNRWSQTDQFISRGFIYPFLHSFTDLLDTSEPEGYSDEKAEDILADYRDEDIPADKRVNLIFIQLEAFADFSNLGAFPLEHDPYAYWHTLEEEAYSGSLLVNIFAGGTVDTERSVLCGFSSLPSFRQNTMSYAWYFRSQGYQTVGAHPCNNWFYNRRNINSYLGFSEYQFSEDTFSALSGGATAPDSILFPYILERYEDAVAQGTPLFSFNVSYQGHGPYSGEEQQFREVYCSGEGVSQEAYCIVNNYLASVADTQEQLKTLVDGLRRSDAPAVLVLFGDHMPWLGDGNSVYTEYGVNLDLSGDQGFRNYYGTPYLIWANEKAKEVTGSDFTGEGPAVSPCFLMNLLFRQCGYRGDSFLQIAGEVMDVLPVLHSSGLYDDRFMLADGVDPAEIHAALDRYLTVQYYRKHHFSAK